MAYTNETELNTVSGDTGRALRAEKKVKLVIDKRTEDDLPWEGGINGYFFRIKRGVEVQVPESLARLIEQNERVTRLSSDSVKEYVVGRGKRLG